MAEVGSYKLIKKSSQCKARLGQVYTTRGVIDTPVFMPVGTQGTVKGVPNEDLQNSGAQIILANSYHLYLRPGTEIIKKAGGIQKFNSWNRPMLTDSGGFQIFSLNEIRKLTEDGAKFQSHIDGSSHFFSPEKSMQIQKDIGADIIMCFDECTPYPATYKYAKNSMELSLRWAKRCREEFYKDDACKTQSLFGIIQGSTYEDLRKISAQEMTEMNFTGYAIGGVSVGEPKEEKEKVIETVEPYLPENKARYLMGVGMPEDLWEGVSRGIDMFDCVIPTRNGRNGQVFTSMGKINIRNAEFKEDFTSLDPQCNCPTCKGYSKAYLNHLVRAQESLYLGLLSLHNIYFMINLMSKIRKSLENDTFLEAKKEFFENYYSRGTR
ncbi:tRNA guanosine(34) transglycosylase Tgt [Endomicrobium proavitum]|uniref:Queuine tRNA-ribosyltransferase n=1 Tax=Endomicrobium proavitum TaxID=1408281 RepID=A0A0G3WJ61_9BACT|nr:tRNA guanosine(34) transglycosylase Tgt [Endomicrobium proavitum]AKL97930.1 tRNA-guanine transglycosylase [Endomicrobium proavitum]